VAGAIGRMRGTRKLPSMRTRRRIRGARGGRLRRRRAELAERSFAHLYDTGGMRRTHLRGHDNILKRLLIHAGGFNLGLVMRQCLGVGKPRRLQGRLAAALRAFLMLFTRLGAPRAGENPCSADDARLAALSRRFELLPVAA
jgi:transposase